MISGHVNAELEARLLLCVEDDDGKPVQTSFLVDTGFSGFITLPSSVVKSLAFPFVTTEEVLLADDSLVDVSLHEGSVIWNGEPKTSSYSLHGRPGAVGYVALIRPPSHNGRRF